MHQIVRISKLYKTNHWITHISNKQHFRKMVIRQRAQNKWLKPYKPKVILDMIREMNTWYNEEIHFFLIQFDINFVLNGINHQKTNQIYKIPIVMPIKKRIHSHNQRIHVFWTFLRVLCWKYWFLPSFMLIILDIRFLISRICKCIIPKKTHNPLV